LSGYHNVLNACGAYGLWRELAARHESRGSPGSHESHGNEDNPFCDAAFATGLASFQGVKKRLDRKGELNGALLFEDFGHHPTAIRAVLAGLRQRHPERRVVTAFRAESNTSRTPLFEAQYVEAFTGTDRLLLAPTLAKRDYLKTARYFDPVQIAATLRERDVEATAHGSVNELAETLRRELGEGDLFILFSSRGMDGLFDLLR
jgi:UDP-N-acetylmuramate: L-alanyl-gamma-D-glutamyl-meso-diaminopimelate ligase